MYMSMMPFLKRHLGAPTSTVADLMGGASDARPPLAQNFFIFMQFSGKIDQIIG